MSNINFFKSERLPGLDPRWPYRPIRILLVDEDKAFGDTLANRLMKRDFAVSQVYSSADGIHLLQRAYFDIAILDPGVDILDRVEGFKRTAPDMPVIVLTQQGSTETTKEAMAFGAFDFLSKPFELEELLGKITSAYHWEEEPIE